MNNYNSKQISILDLQTLGYDQDLILIKDFLLQMQKNEDVNPNLVGLLENPPLEENGGLQKDRIVYALRPVNYDRNYSYQGDLLPGLRTPGGKTSFLVFKNQKYTTVKTDSIAFFYIRNGSVSIMCFDGQEFALNQPLDHITHLVSSAQFFRVNRKYLINFKAIKEVEHYFLRKLFVKLVIETPDKLLINKEKSSAFLNWMEDR